MKKRTTEEFVRKCAVKHGDKYDYSCTVYQSSHEKIAVRCKKHDLIFTQMAYMHVAGQGCPTCGNENKNKNRLTTTSLDTFLERAKTMHGDLYDYSSVEYAGIANPVLIRCKRHDHSFMQSPYNHSVNGAKCPLCNAQETSERLKKSPEQYIEECVNVHGNKYSYDRTVYVSSSDKVLVRCNTHSRYFSIEANAHLQGKGCAACAENGYKRKFQGSLYIFISEDMVKVGISNRSVERRLKAVSKSSGQQFYKYRQWQWEDGGVADDLETYLLSKLRESYKNPLRQFDGYTECFTSVSPDYVVGLVELKLEEIYGNN